MSFVQIEFFVFCLAVVMLISLLKNTNQKKITLLIANIYFYAYIDFHFLILLLLLTSTNYLIGKKIDQSTAITKRKLWLIVGILLNASFLVYFKYYNFFIENINQVFLRDQDYFSILVPIGISFYSFRFISYLVDIYRSKNMPQHSIVDFVIYGTFFPIMIAGPLARAKRFLPQLSAIKVSRLHLYEAYRLFVIGLFLKYFVADHIAPYVNYFYKNYELFNQISSWIATVAYSIQIYCDFAGYSSMAIGLSLMIGFNIEDNFNFPYTATNISDFWRRWHITLSEWIRDYLYIPLGGNRMGTLRKYINLIIAMTICGIWHGAAWTFLIWGLYHGVLLTLNHHWKSYTPSSFTVNFPRSYAFFSWGITFFFITMGWVIFRSKDISQAFRIFSKLFLFNSEGLAWYHPFIIFIIAATALFHFFYLKGIQLVTLTSKTKLTPAFLFCLLWIVIVFFPKEFEPFVYANF